MNRVEELIQQLCPNGVEWKKLGEVCEIKGRIGFRGYTQKDLVKEEEGAITLSPSNIINECLDFRNCSYISWFKYNESPEIQAEIGDVLFTKTASVGKCALIKYLPKSATINPQLVLLKKITCNAAYLTYVLLGNNFQDEVKKVTGIGSVPNIPQSSLSQIRIPIPPLSIQQEIVRILDTFTELTANLQTELDARKKQYAYYRDCLLNFEGVDGVEWKKLGEIGLFYGGLSGKTKKDFEEGNAKYVTYSNIFNNIAVNLNINDVVNILPGEKQNVIAYGDVIFTGSSETPDECGMSSVVTEIINEPIYLNSFCFGFRLNNLSLYEPGFLKFLFRSNNIRNEIKKTANGVTRYNISKKLFSQIEIPIPPLPEQRRIVAILDHFETLVNDLSVGLPAELEARRKQYEYYRDKLLTFDRV